MFVSLIFSISTDFPTIDGDYRVMQQKVRISITMNANFSLHDPVNIEVYGQVPPITPEAGEKRLLFEIMVIVKYISMYFLFLTG